MFESYDPRQGKRLQIMDEAGNIDSSVKDVPLMNDNDILVAYKYMSKARVVDEWSVNLNRQGRLPTYPPGKGQEANSVGSLMALNQDDWFVPAYRELGGMLYRGIPLSKLYQVWLGNEKGSHFEIEKYHTFPISVPIASQCLHAVGAAYANQYLKNNRVTICFVGDGGTSEGDFLEALNVAGTWNIPLIFYIQNNQWAISVPRNKQTRSATLAEKAFAFGFEGVQVDGNDVLSVFAATKMAKDKALKNQGPTLIEGYTYRLGAHTTADDPTIYRKQEEVEQWVTKDPLLRLEKYLLNKNLIDESTINSLKEDYKKEFLKEFELAENAPPHTVEEIFAWQFKQIPEDMKEQMNLLNLRLKGSM